MLDTDSGRSPSSSVLPSRFLSLVVLLALIGAAPAWATIVVEHVIQRSGDAFTASPTPGNEIRLGDTIDVDVRLHWDGQGSLLGVFTSTQFNSDGLELVGSTSAPGVIFPSFDPVTGELVNALSRLTTSIRSPGDPLGVLRTVQYGSFEPVLGSPTPEGGILIRRLTFRVIGLGSSLLPFEGLLASGEGVVLASGNELPIFVTTFVPEPGTAWLLGLGLMALARRPLLGRDAGPRLREPA